MRLLFLFAALLLAAPANAATLAATCATISTVLPLAQPGDTVKLEGDCGEIVVANRYSGRVTIDAAKASVKGLRLTGENITWLGGVLVAPDGMDGFAAKGYAVSIHGANIRLAHALVTDAKKGVVVDQARNITIEQVKFWRMREDGIIASRLVNASFDDNVFSEFRPRPTRCDVGGVITEGLPKRDCAGIWTDGNHADGIQLRNGVINARIRRNSVFGDFQGAIGQYDTTGDAPLERVLIEGNSARVTGFNSYTLGNCIGCRIERNRAWKGNPLRRVPVRPGMATTCGNEIEGEKPDAPC